MERIADGYHKYVTSIMVLISCDVLGNRNVNPTLITNGKALVVDRAVDIWQVAENIYSFSPLPRLYRFVTAWNLRGGVGEKKARQPQCEDKIAL